jgi:DNA-binding response OmpR family regulator
MRNILIVDDQPYLYELLSQGLMRGHYEVAAAADAQSVKRYLEASEPDLVLLEPSLQGFEGWDLLRDIKGTDPSLPVLIVTAYDSYVHDSRASQADGYVIKNVSHLQELKEKWQKP